MINKIWGWMKRKPISLIAGGIAAVSWGLIGGFGMINIGATYTPEQVYIIVIGSLAATIWVGCLVKNMYMFWIEDKRIIKGSDEYEQHKDKKKKDKKNSKKFIMFKNEQKIKENEYLELYDKMELLGTDYELPKSKYHKLFEETEHKLEIEKKASEATANQAQEALDKVVLKHSKELNKVIDDNNKEKKILSIVEINSVKDAERFKLCIDKYKDTEYLKTVDKKTIRYKDPNLVGKYDKDKSIIV